MSHLNPRLLHLFFSLIIWGWMNQTWVVTGVLLLLMSLSFLTNKRRQFTRTQFYRLIDLSMLLLLLFLVYSYLTQSDTNPIFSLLKWAPVLFFPVLLTQLYSAQNKLPIDALFYSLRSIADKQESINDHQHNKPIEIDFVLPFTAISIVSAGASNVQGNEYFILSVIIISLILWFERPGMTKKMVWLLIILVAIGFSYWGHHGLKQLSEYLQDKAVEWLDNTIMDPFESSTSIGKIGDLKLSDKIVFRVKAHAPLLLHQASYDRYFGHEWYASKLSFKPFGNKKINSTGHQSASPLTSRMQLEIYQTFSHDSILALPDGVTAIDGLGDTELRQTQLGAVKILKPPSYAKYQVLYTGKRQNKVTRLDMDIPQQHRHWLQMLYLKLKLQQKTPKEIASSIENFFKASYSYTLFTPNQADADQALTEFILERHAGHCEYFAVATVFLLRYAGIPARLANGYSMQEYDDSLGMYIVRNRHAHAWAMAKIGDVWQAVDTTPSQWLFVENENTHFLQPVGDWFSTLFFHFKQWSADIDGLNDDNVLLAIVLVLICYISYLSYKTRQQFSHNKLVETPHQQPLLNKKSYPGDDSELFIIEQYLQQQNQYRNENESFNDWVKRLGVVGLENIVQLHYRYRFDPQGLSDEQRNELALLVKKWIAKQKIILIK
ncbi:MAG: transglutaminase domain-containing protein [Methylococcales bacterium]|nr:transglutaminase domain-containing protein [Methylococcales bacterium]